MKTLKSTDFLSIILGVVCLSILFTPSIAQEYDDMYFNKSDRKKIKVEKKVAISDKNTTTDYNKITESTEAYSAKNVNPEYIARYKSTEADELNSTSQDSYGSKDYFVEDFDKQSYVSDANKNEIDYSLLSYQLLPFLPGK